MTGRTLEGVEVRRLRLKPGDHIVLRSHKHLASDECLQIKAAAEQRWPGHPITVLNDMEIDVLEAVPSP